MISATDSAVTLRKDDPVELDQTNASPKIMKRQILTFPIVKPLDRSGPEVNDIKQKNREFKKKVERQKDIDEIAEFEKRMFGKAEKPPPIEITPPSKEQLELLQSLSPPSPVQFWNIYSPPVSCPVSPRTRHIQSELAELPFSQKNSPRAQTRLSESPSRVKPAIWTLLDEPTMPSSEFGEHRPLRNPKRPFYRRAGFGDNSRGIPIVSRDMREDNERKARHFMTTVKYLAKRDMMKKEKIVRARVKESLTASRKKREQTAHLCNVTGQDWVVRMVAEKHCRKLRQEIPAPPTKEEIEAMENLAKRDEQMRSAALLKRTDPELSV